MLLISVAKNYDASQIPVDWYPWLCNTIQDPPFLDPDPYLHKDQYNLKWIQWNREPNKLSQLGSKGTHYFFFIDIRYVTMVHTIYLFLLF